LTLAPAASTLEPVAEDAYLEYLARWEKQLPNAAVGGYGQFKGKMVRKLAPAEFLSRLDEYQELSSHYQKCLERGDTLNDAMVKLLRERQLELLLEA
jgi:hypothetical protein